MADANRPLVFETKGEAIELPLFCVRAERQFCLHFPFAALRYCSCLVNFP